MTSDMPIRIALRQTLDGLGDILCKVYADDLLMGASRVSHDPANLYWMWQTATQNLMIWPVDKTSRWIGFIQGVLTVSGVLDTNEERDRTRPFFHEAYEAMGFDKPKTSQHPSQGS